MVTKITDAAKRPKKNQLHHGLKELENDFMTDEEQDEAVDSASGETSADVDAEADSEERGSWQEDVLEDNVISIARRSKKPFVITGIVLLVVLALGGYFYLNRTRTEYVVDSEIERTDETTMQYLSYNGGFIKYNVDGITYEDRTGTIVWTEALTMTDPKVVICGEYVAITDIGNNEYTLYNSAKKLNTFKTDYPITDIQVASQGLVAVALEDEKVNYIDAFDRSGDKCVEIKTTINKNGYPLAIALSNDGQKLVASYITIENSKVESSLTFYNFGDVGKNEVDRQVGYKKFDDELIPRIQFVDNNTVCAFGTTHMVLYAMKQKPKEILTQKMEDDVKSVFCNERYVGYICKVETKTQASGDSAEADSSSDGATPAYNLKAYNLSGRLELEEDIDFNYSNVHSSADEVVVLSDTQCKIYKYNGFVKYDGVIEDGISDFFPTDRKNHYVLITGDKTRMIHLK